MRVFVYYNLHKHVWSVKALEGPDKGRVIARSDFVLLANPVGKVSEAGRQRVLREGRKNVHAGIVGRLLALEPHAPLASPRPVTYNPKKYQSFVYADDKAPFEGASFASMNAIERSVLVANS